MSWPITAELEAGRSATSTTATSSTFSMQDARACLDVSAAAYARAATIATELCHCLIVDAPCGESTIVAFRGSASVRDWLTDLQCKWTGVDGMDGMNAGRSATSATAIGAGEKIHHGFLDALLSEGFAERLSSWWGRPWPTKPIYITGHSLGAAMAILAAEVLARAGAPVAAVYTFGGPRVGNAAFARNYNSLKVITAADPAGAPVAREVTLGDRTFRFVDEEDIVPRIPFWHWGYRHVGQEVFLPSIGGMRMNPPLVYKAISDVIGTWLDWRRGEVAQLVDHPVTAYQRRLAE